VTIPASEVFDDRTCEYSLRVFAIQLASARVAGAVGFMSYRLPRVTARYTDMLSRSGLTGELKAPLTKRSKLCPARS
jgi:hypothetical protein